MVGAMYLVNEDNLGGYSTVRNNVLRTYNLGAAGVDRLILSIPTARLGCFGRKTWNYLCYDGATRRSKLIGTRQESPTKAAAWKEVERLQVRTAHDEETIGDTLQDVITRYEAERMPSRKSTARAYRSFLNCTESSPSEEERPGRIDSTVLKRMMQTEM